MTLLKYKLFNKINFLSCLFYLIPFALLTGPFLPDLILSLIVLIFLALIFSEKQYQYFQNNFFKFFFIFYLILILCSFFSVNIFISIQNSIVYIRFILFALATWYVLDRNPSFINNFFFALIFAFIFALFSGYYQYFTGANFYGITPADTYRLTLPFNDRMILGGYLARLFPLIFALSIILLSKKNVLYYILILLLLIITDVLVYITGERTALGLMLLSTVLIILLIKRFKFLRVASLIFSLIIILSISIYDSDIKERNIDHTFNQIGLNGSDEANAKINYFSPKHQSMVLTSWNIFSENLIFGSGPSTFRIVCDDKIYKENDLSCSTHPHNIYFQLLAETGIIGSAFICAIALYVFYQLLRSFRSIILNRDIFLNDYEICLLTCFVLSLWPVLPTLSFFNNWINVIYYLPIGFFLHSIYSKQK